MRALALILLALALSGAFPALAVPLSPNELPAPGVVTAPTPADEAYRRALQNLTDGNLDAAGRAFNESLKLEPKSAKAMLGLAEIAFRNKKLDEAGKWIRRAVETDPGSSEAYASLGRYYALQGKNSEAEAALRKASELDPRAVRPRVDLGDLLSFQRRLPDAIKFYQEAVALNPQHAGAHYALGIALARQGDNAKAQAELEHAARLEANNPLPKLALARVHASLKDPDKALVELNNALAIQPSLVDALLLKGDLLDAKGQTTEATMAYQMAAKAAPKFALPHLKIAMMSDRNGQTDLAIASYKKVIELDPKQAVAYNNLAALALERKQNLAQAEVWAKKAVELGPNVADYYDTLGWLQHARNNSRGALAALQKATQLEPRDPAIQYHLGVLYAETGDKIKAIEALKRALNASNHFPSYAEAEKLMKTLQQ